MIHRAEQLYKNKSYIKWFLNKYYLKEEKTRILLEYLLNNSETLARVNFVEDIRPYPNAVLISSEDAKTVSYLLRIEGKYFEDVDEFITFLKTKPTIDLNIWLAFNREFICSACSGIVQETPEFSFTSKAKQRVYDLEVSILATLKVKEEKKKKLITAIDGALLSRNEEEFIRLTNLLKELN